MTAAMPDEAIAALLDAGAPLERPDDSGATALFHALGHRDLALTQTLLDAGASPHAANRNGVRGETLVDLVPKTLPAKMRRVAAKH